MAEQRWAALARELAAVVRRTEQVNAERMELASRRERLEGQLATMLEAEEEQPRAPLARVPAWASERMEQTVAPGHGNSTSVLRSNAPLSELSAEVPCSGPLVCGAAYAGLPHVHSADGVVTEYTKK